MCWSGAMDGMHGDDSWIEGCVDGCFDMEVDARISTYQIADGVDIYLSIDRSIDPSIFPHYKQ